MKKNSRTRQAVDALQQARYERKWKGPYNLAHVFEEEADQLIVPQSPPMVCSGEVLPGKDDDSNAGFCIRDTLVDPDSAAVDASLHRTGLLVESGALELGIDAANSIQAQNSLEKMLAHQMAVCHTFAMSLVSQHVYQSDDPLTQEMKIRKISAAAKLFDVFQRGMETLAKCRNSGKQTIVVKQVHVSGGQNVIADSVNTGNHGEG